MKAGIDFSITCPCITVGNSKDFDNCTTFFYIDKTKFVGNLTHKLIGVKQIPYELEIERFHNISEWAIAIMNTMKVDEVVIEGYSMGSKGHVFNIGENTGLLKYNLWKKNIKYYTPAPTTVKKYFTGKGNANKEMMYNTFLEKTGIDLQIILNQKPDKNPISDIVDSYAMLCYGIDNCF